MVTEQIVASRLLASSRISSGGHVWLILLGVLFIAGGLFMAINPRRAARPPKWEFKNRAEPSAFSIDLVRIGGVVWTLAGIGFVIAAAAG
jgi:hypothetical protein